LGDENMATAAVRIPEKTRDVLKVIARIEKREMKEILTELIDEYIERHKETLDILSKPEWIDIIEKGKAEITQGTHGKSLDELEA
jgi:actin-like ATPase involved in cell morphogenesis